VSSQKCYTPQALHQAAARRTAQDQATAKQHSTAGTRSAAQYQATGQGKAKHLTKIAGKRPKHLGKAKKQQGPPRNENVFIFLFVVKK